MFLNKPVEKSSLLDQAAESVDQSILSTQQVANDALEKLTQAMQDLRHQAMPLVERGADSLRQTTHQLCVKAERATESTADHIRHDPLKSVLIAAATGAALMALVNLVSHARDRH
ncbi:MAG: hypothetical protein AUJ20_12440 [Comamonadaceae bacterium CG1_02_60_18]|nr:MAG: hypothetical protein AUJ20_12440 [Comamonadaceae bacterium CG1_02_60_18]PIQ50692.1 MAG: hypothetical protein COW02_18945 [Comamonadaceae bacterium CG12_big_fil_rev_8_21_14_0_65_59_15]